MKIKSYFIIVLLCIVTLLFATSFTFAGNIGRAVYGVLTETYNGASTSASAGNDRIYIAGSPRTNRTDKKEGEYSHSINAYWIGAWFTSDGEWGSNPQDMSAYAGGRVYFSAKVPTTIDLENTGNVFKVADGNDKVVYFNSTNIKRIDSNLTGINNDNNWHTYYIELSSFVDPLTNDGLNLSNITYLFVLGSTSNDNSLLIDNVYWTKAPNATRAFNVTVKNISDNQVATNDKITWTQAAYRQSWTAAQQYIELDLDKESSNWYVRMYLNNGKTSRKGLYCVDSDGSEIVLPMAWRISRDLLPNSDATFQIKEDSWGWLYDSGKTTPDANGVAWAWPWAKFFDITDTGLDLPNTIAWSLQGCHLFLYTGETWAYQSFADYYERKPKIYFAADCSNAIGGLEYEANVVTELVYE
ncbi:hypothetical protein [Candidatus Ruminimicrobiellum ovillum]|uniref:hypothetical protein n=1 Tax=Candidatus Ruminimicrobiellum ovillum TaxID=1947927 RepID=UPI00355AA7F4